MTEITTMDAAEIMRKHLEDAGPDQLREMVRFFAEALMSADADAACGAPYGERSSERRNQRNGYRQRRWDTRAMARLLPASTHELKPRKAPAAVPHRDSGDEPAQVEAA